MKEIKDIKNYKLSNNIVSYLYSLKMNKKNEVYETLMLMILNDKFLKVFDSLIKNNLEKIKVSKDKSSFNIQSSKELEAVVDLVLDSKYFVENFDKNEIIRKKEIIKNIIVEIVLSSYLSMLGSVEGVNYKVAVNFFKVKYPGIVHKLLKNKDSSRLQITFEEGTSLDELIRYLKDLGIKNIPKKKKMSLGQSFRALYILDEIKSDPLKFSGEKYEYIEQLVAREMLSRYKEDLSVDAITKSLQRIKKIKKDINTKKDK